ncbi:STE3-type pheromone receptor [Ceratobasidium sp. AG-Ba]|nr:STE3-type pheromone receptor [Ceratobasidium sp. AG-Ba]QRV99457.1 STE3-type pheromone receptor [Ceratobasidium sp. AG-Ba]QRW13968.1 STE3-type pheromone receptor [Ceratobasidium sp. AG-Ba]
MRIELPIVSFICTILVLIPLPWHWKARNVNTLAIIAWLALVNLTRGINAIIWGGNIIIKYKVWCDITTKLVIGANVGLPAATLCICRYLAAVASPRHTIANAKDKKRRMIFEFVMTVGVPIIAMALHYVVQGHRFDLLEDFGCNPTTYVSVPALFIVYLPPLFLALGTLVYAGIALRWFVHRRAQFQAVLQSSQTGLTTGRYLRLIALAVTEMLFATAMTLFVLVITIEDGGLRPWISWEDVHYDWLRIGQFARIIVPQYFWDRLLLTWYIIPITSVIFFAFFGFGQEAKAEYLKAWRWVQKKVFRITPKPQPVLPVSARGGISTINSTISTPAMVKLSDTTSTPEKWDDAPASTYTTSRPPSPDKPSATLEREDSRV